MKPETQAAVDAVLCFCGSENSRIMLCWCGFSFLWMEFALMTEHGECINEKHSGNLQDAVILIKIWTAKQNRFKYYKVILTVHLLSSEDNSKGQIIIFLWKEREDKVTVWYEVVWGGWLNRKKTYDNYFQFLGEFHIMSTASSFILQLLLGCSPQK